MRPIERRLKQIEKQVNTEEKLPYIFISPDSTFGEVKADFEAKTRRTLSTDEFKALLPRIPKVVWEIVTHGGVRRCEWYEDLHKDGKATRGESV